MASLIMIRSFAVVVSVHNGISTAITSSTRIIRMLLLVLLWIMDTSGKQQRKTDEQCFFSDGIHTYSPRWLI